MTDNEEAMGNLPRTFSLAAGLLLLVAWTCPCAQEPDEASSSMILGAANPMLSAGADALQAGRIQQGIQLTLAGLKVASSNLEAAVGHSNACAGFALLKQWDEALVHCNAALALDSSNWHVYNNRAAIYAQKGLFELAVRDLQTGLNIAPRSAMLQESLRIVEHNKRLLEKRGRKALWS